MIAIAARLLAAGLLVWQAQVAVAPGLLAQTCPSAVSASAQPVTLELDYLADTNAVTTRTVPDCTMEMSFAALGLNLTVTKTRESFTPRDPSDCIWPDEAESLLCGTLGGDGEWYAHGVVIPNPAVYELDSTGTWVCPGGRLGQIYFPICPSVVGAAGSSLLARKHFLAFWRDSPNNTVGRDNDAFVTNVHETGHVLNLHHCEFNADGLDNKGIFLDNGSSAGHVSERNQSQSHVMPGASALPGKGFCEYDKRHFRRYHSGSTCCEAVTEVFREDYPTESGPALSALRDSLELTADPEKALYLPGEPIHVNVALRPRHGASGAATYMHHPDSLNPDFGYLLLAVAAARKADKYATLRGPVLAERGGTETIPVGKGVSREGVGIWFTLPDAHLPEEKSFWLRADFVGFEDPALLLSSKEVKVEVGRCRAHPDLFHKKAYALFTRPLSRRFIYLLGGDHIKEGLENLSEISRTYGGTIYSPYADVTLGVYWSRPFHGIDAHGATITREADATKALRHLRKAKAWNEEHAHDPLAPSWKRLLDATLARVESPAVDPNGARRSHP